MLLDHQDYTCSRNFCSQYSVIEEVYELEKSVYCDLNKHGEKVYRRDGHHYGVESVTLVFIENNSRHRL